MNPADSAGFVYPCWCRLQGATTPVNLGNPYGSSRPQAANRLPCWNASLMTVSGHSAVNDMSSCELMSFFDPNQYISDGYRMPFLIGQIRLCVYVSNSGVVVVENPFSSFLLGNKKDERNSLLTRRRFFTRFLVHTFR